MQRRSLPHPGNKTSPAQQRINRAMSMAALSRLLQTNFADGARLIVLAYSPGGYIPTGTYAEQDITEWVRLSRKQLGGSFQYLRFTGQGHSPQTATVHHVAVPLHLGAVERLAGIWEYGPARIERVECGQLVELAEQLEGSANAGPWRRAYSSSKGLIRV